jgi:hypothetical protein
MKTEMSVESMVSKALKAELKQAFPEITFSVRESHHGCVDVLYNAIHHQLNAEQQKTMEKTVQKYKLGYFDGLTDSYEYTNRRNDIPQVKYIFINPYGKNREMKP